MQIPCKTTTPAGKDEKPGPSANDGVTVDQVRQDVIDKAGIIVCGCIKTLVILGHGNKGLQLVGARADPDVRSKGALSATENKKSGGWKFQGMELFDGISSLFCDPCSITLGGCLTGKGVKGLALHKEINRITGCSMHGFRTEQITPHGKMPISTETKKGPEQIYPPLMNPQTRRLLEAKGRDL